MLVFSSRHPDAIPVQLRAGDGRRGGGAGQPEPRAGTGAAVSSRFSDVPDATILTPQHCHDGWLRTAAQGTFAFRGLTRPRGAESRSVDGLVESCQCRVVVVIVRWTPTRPYHLLYRLPACHGTPPPATHKPGWLTTTVNIFHVQ